MSLTKRNKAINSYVDAKYKQELRAVSPRVWCVLSVCSVARVFRCCWQGHSPPLPCSPRPAVSPDPHRPCIHCRQMLRGIAIQLIQHQDNCRDLHEIFFCFRSKYFQDVFWYRSHISPSSALEFRIIYEFNFKSLKLIIYMKIKDNSPEDLSFMEKIFKSLKDGNILPHKIRMLCRSWQ